MTKILTNTKLQFSGHETFPLRQLWLRKVHDEVKTADDNSNSKIFTDDSAIAKFGVGKNMVSSMRFWANACEIIEESADKNNTYKITTIGDIIFKDENDPFCENPATVWLLHWILANNPTKTTTWYYLFNHISQQSFDRETVVKGILSVCKERAMKISEATLKRDIDCCLRSYVPKASGDSPEEMSEPLLGELNIIQQSSKGTFEFRRGPKKTLPDAIFAYALLDYWQNLESDKTTTSRLTSVMGFDKVAHDFGSPGRVFKLDESAVADRLIALEELTDGELQWTEQAGIRQVTRTGLALRNIEATKYKYLRSAYEN